MGPIRIFIGTDESQVVPTAVLRHNITSRTDAAVKFHEFTDLNTGLEQNFYAGFGFYRWGIPSFCDYTGSAIYLDTDIVVLCDIRESWDLDMGGHSHLCRPRPAFQLRKFRLNQLGGAYASVMLLDCARCRDWDFEAGRGRSEILQAGDVVPQRLANRSRSRCPPHGVQRSRPTCPGAGPRSFTTPTCPISPGRSQGTDTKASFERRCARRTRQASSNWRPSRPQSPMDTSTLRWPTGVGPVNGRDGPCARLANRP